MSELTTCNFCSLKAMRKRREGTGERVIVRYNSLWFGNGGCNVYALPKDFRMPPEGIIESGPLHDKYHLAWFAGLTDHCVC